MRTSAISLGIWMVVAQMGVAGEARPERPAVTWGELADALSVLPSPEQAKHPGRYRVREKEKNESRSRIEALKKKGDIIPPIVDRLKQPPKNERDEAEIYNLVLILKENLDERALPVLEQLAASAPITSYIVRDEGGKQYRYPYHLAARELIRRLEVDQAVDQWETELKGLSKQERLDRLADTWMSPERTASPRDRAALTLLGKMDKSAVVAAILKRLPGIENPSEKEASVIVGCMGWLKLAVKEQIEANAARRILEEAAKSRHEQVSLVAQEKLRELEKGW